MTYFQVGMVMVFFFNPAFIFERTRCLLYPQATNLLSVLIQTAFAAFVISTAGKKREEKPVETHNPPMKPERPRV